MELYHAIVLLMVCALIIFFWIWFALNPNDPVQWIALTLAIVGTILIIIYLWGKHHFVCWSL